ncbi:MAG: hypothetical protein KID02_07200 [Clostridiales bacterium]|nr:hypothetical protein [Clostridiales bacterium]
MKYRNYLMTKGVQRNVDFLLVMILFELRETIPVKDYLTIIYLKRAGEEKCLIRIEQEQPEYVMEQEIDYSIGKDEKLYIIDDGMNLTCMYPDEY